MKLKTIMFTAIIGFVLILIYTNIFYNPILPHKVNADNILKIKPGMSLEQVCKILGKPLKIEGLYGSHDISCSKPNYLLIDEVDSKTDIKKIINDFIINKNYCCVTYKKDVQKFNKITLVYTKEGIFNAFPMLWVHIDKSYNVNSIYAKEYEEGFIGDDVEIYSYCFVWVFDSTCLDKTKTEKLINKEKFFRNFK
jgi:hypothetical protein